jgi:hypothetical protein
MNYKRRVKVHFKLNPDEDGYPPAESEFLWCIPTDHGTYMIDNIPFFVREMSIGDEISAEKKGGRLQFKGLLRKSQNSTLRILMKTSDVLDKVREKLDNLGCGTELMEELALIAVTIPPDCSVIEVLSFLDDQAAQGNIGIEESSVRYQHEQ